MKALFLAEDKSPTLPLIRYFVAGGMSGAQKEDTAQSIENEDCLVDLS